MVSHVEPRNNPIIDGVTGRTAPNEKHSTPNTNYLGDTSICVDNESFFMLEIDVGSSNIDVKTVMKCERKP